jgi:FKBP-type peptidyl-prolyl cis-trans isomerase
MKSKSLATLSLLALGLAAAQAQDVKLNIPGQPAQAGQQPAAAPTPAKAEFTDAQLIEEFGWFVGKRVGLSELALSKEELATFLKGLNDAAAGKDSPYELEKIGPAMDEFMQKKQTAYMEKMKAKNDAANTAYFAKLKENKAVVALPSGLHYEIIKQGEGAMPKTSDTVKVHYTGTLLDGAVFDSSVKRGTPAEFQLDQVIPGWTEGLQKLNKGGKIKLHVPPQLAYGEEGRPGIPPGSTLVFEVDLLDIVNAAPAAAPTAQPAKK